MSKKETIENRVKALAEREERIKQQLDSDSDEMRDKAMRVGKIALVTGGVVLVGYWLFNVFFGDEEENEEEPKQKKKPDRTKSANSRVTALLMPYLNKFLDGILEEFQQEEQSKKEGESGKVKED